MATNPVGVGPLDQAPKNHSSLGIGVRVALFHYLGRE